MIQLSHATLSRHSLTRLSRATLSLAQVNARGGVDAAAYPCLVDLVHEARQSTQKGPSSGTPTKLGSRGLRSLAADTAASTILQLETRLSAAQARLSQREEALGAAQEDLARDELIFRQRMAELHALRQALRQAEADTAGCVCNPNPNSGRRRRTRPGAWVPQRCTRGGAG
jgi:hypothetical protein